MNQVSNTALYVIGDFNPIDIHYSNFSKPNVNSNFERMPDWLKDEMFDTINAKWPHSNLKRKSGERTKISGQFNRTVANQLIKRVKGLNKIYNGSGANSYGYFMQTPAYEFFVDFVCNFEEILAQREKQVLLNTIAVNQASAGKAPRL